MQKTIKNKKYSKIPTVFSKPQTWRSLSQKDFHPHYFRATPCQECALIQGTLRYQGKVIYALSTLSKQWV